MRIGQLAGFSLSLGQLIWPMFAAGWVLSLIERGRAAWARLQPTLREPLAIVDHGTTREFGPGELSLREGTFTYPGQSAPALAGVSVAVAAGATLGIVGPTVCGKSTLVHLLMRRFAPDTGAIRHNGRLLAAYTLDAWSGGMS